MGYIALWRDAFGSLAKLHCEPIQLAIPLLRLMKSPEAVSLLKIILNDKNSGLSSDALFALKFQDFDADILGFVVGMLKDRGAGKDLKTAGLEWLEAHQQKIPSLKQSLLPYMKAERDQDLRRKAKSVIDLEATG